MRRIDNQGRGGIMFSASLQKQNALFTDTSEVKLHLCNSCDYFVC